MVIVTLAHHIDLVWMYEAYRQTEPVNVVETRTGDIY
jgi:hypothetical protein